MAHRLAVTVLLAALLLLGSCKSPGGSGGNNGNPDTTPPTIAIPGDPGGTVVSGPLGISATASDDMGVTQFTLTVDGGVAIPSSNGDPAFSIDTTTLTSDLHTLVFSARDAAGNLATKTIRITVNQSPVASLTTTSRRSGPAVLNVTLDASGSTDPDGPGPLEYAFDFDGDGSADSAPSTDPRASFLYAAQGTFHPKVTVSDRVLVGDVRTPATVVLDGDPIKVTSNGWGVSTLPNSPSGGTGPVSVKSITAVNIFDEHRVALAVAAANPSHILTYDSVGGSHPLTWSDPVDVGLGSRASIFQVSDRPGLLYTQKGQSGSFDLFYAQAADGRATSWGNPNLVSKDVLGPDFQFQGLAISGKPAAFYTSSTTDPPSIFFSVADSADGQSWTAPPTQLIQTGIQVGDLLAGKVGGNPAFLSTTSLGTIFSASFDPAGSTWRSAPLLIFDSITQTQHSPLVEVHGNPAIIVPTSGKIKFSQSSDQNGGLWPGLHDVATTSSVNCILCSDPSLGGLPPLVCFMEGGLVQYCFATDADGNGWTAPASIDTGAGDSLQACVREGQTSAANDQFVLAYTKGSDIRVATFPAE